VFHVFVWKDDTKISLGEIDCVHPSGCRFHGKLFFPVIGLPKELRRKADAFVEFSLGTHY
jgi:hypothetical protein